MRTVSVEQAMYLIRRETGPCLTFYLPTEVAGKETLQNPVRFKNLLKIIERQINESGDKSPADLLEKPRKLVEDYSFWQHQTRGLAVLVDKNSMHCFELPYPPKELAVLGQNFHLAPLLPLLASDDLFYLLALSQNEVRLFRCNRYGAERIVADTIPTSLAEALPYQDPERQLQVRTTGPTGGAVFHGHGAGGDGNQDKKDSIARFFRLVDEAVHHETREEPAPMILAGVAELFPLYTAVTRNKEILEAGVEGNVEGVDGTELWGRARAIVQHNELHREREQASG